MSRKRPREAINVDTEAIEIYEDLANEKEEIRLKAAQRLLLKNAIEQAPGLEQLEKVLKRLIRGLCSGRKAARLGFSVALTEFLNQHAGVNASLSAALVVDRLEELTRITAISGQEERDHHFGRLFATGAVIKSNFVLEGDANRDWARLIDLVFELCKRKSWLREECAWVLVGAVKHLDAVSASLEYPELLLCKLNDSGLSRTPEGVAIWITTQQLFPEVDVPKHVWKRGNPLHHSEKGALAKILMESTSKDETKQGIDLVNQKGTWSPRLHFAWSLVFNSILKPPTKCVKFADMWTEAVDDGLFAATASDKRKSWGFTLFQTHVKTVPVAMLPILFGKNLVRSMINQVAAKDRFLHKSATKALNGIHARVEKEPKTALEFVSALTSSSSQANFDKQTKTKTVETILILSDEVSFSSLVERFCKKLRHTGTADSKSATTLRQGISDQLLAVIRSRAYPEISHPSLELRRSSMTSILATFVDLGYFISTLSSISEEEEAGSSVSDQEREKFRSRTSSLLALLIKKESDASLFPLDAVNRIFQLGVDKSTRQQRESILDEHENEPAWHAIQAAVKTLDKLARRRLRDGSHELLTAFELLHAMIILDIYNGDADAIALLDELQACYKMLVDGDSQQTDRGAEILVEVLLSLACKKSSLFRRLAEDAFTVCTSIMTSKALESMIMVVEADEQAVGQDDIFDNNEANSASEASEIDGQDCDVEMIDEQALGNESLDDESSTSSSSEASENADATNDELDEFDRKLAQALGTRRADQDLAIQENESSDEDMDDAQMEALDTHLENMFRERKKVTTAKQARKQARETLTVFKCRVLDLLQIYIKKQHLNPLAIELILPLLATIRLTKSRQVSAKAATVLRDYAQLIKPKSEPSGNSIKAARSAKEVLARIHEEAWQPSSRAHAAACSQTSILVAKILMTHGGSVADVLAQYSVTQLRVLTEKTAHLKASFFADWANWCFSVRGILETEE